MALLLLSAWRTAVLALVLSCHHDVAFCKIVGEFLLNYCLSEYQNLHMQCSNSELNVLLL